MAEEPRRRVLVVDDSPFQRDFVAAALSDAGFQVVTAESGLDGLNRVYEERPDIVVSDVMMPELSGYQFCRIMKNDPDLSGIPVILLTSLSQQKDRFWGGQAGADRYLVKDESMDVVVATVREVLGAALQQRGRRTPPANRSLTETAAKSRLGNILENMLFEATVANRVRELFQVASDPAALAAGLFQFLHEVFRFELGALLVRSPRSVSMHLDLAPGVGRSGARDAIWREVAKAIPGLEEQSITWTVRGGEERSNVFPVIESRTLVPVRVGEVDAGCLVLLSEESTAFGADERRALSVVLRELGSVMRYMATHDEMEAVKADFMSMIVHDLRSPLAGILAGTEILMGGLAGELTDDQRQIVEILTGSSRRLMSLVNEVLDMSRIDAGRLNLHREEFTVHEAIRRVTDESRFIAGEKSITLESSVGPEVSTIHADREKIEQVLINLVTNAVKFTPVGGKVTLRVRLDGDRKGNALRFEVEDNGPGLTDEERSKLFQKYSELEGRKKAELKGTGLGLFICKSVVEAHGGNIGVDSTPGQGSLFHFRLPLPRQG